MDNPQIWKRSVSETAAAIQRAAHETRWLDAEKLSTDLAELLQHPPVNTDLATHRQTLEAAHLALNSVLRHTKEVRSSMAEELRTIHRGRRAVDAYT